MLIKLISLNHLRGNSILIGCLLTSALAISKLCSANLYTSDYWVYSPFLHQVGLAVSTTKLGSRMGCRFWSFLDLWPVHWVAEVSRSKQLLCGREIRFWLWGWCCVGTGFSIVFGWQVVKKNHVDMSISVRDRCGFLRPLLSIGKTVLYRNRRLGESISAINCCCCCRFFWQRWWITVGFGVIIALLSFLWTNCYINLTALAASAIAYTSSKVSLVFWSAEGDTREIILSSNSQESKSWLNVKTTSNLKLWY